ncbi:alginate export protein [Pontibacter ummariensis]|uniref:Alginate export n=1 Tax=Pontibacter ummariensis TaxID=1610492 RepID=A0A239ET59_9BACT|nr:alginate export family protein [Pontibacter ummariensis]PRY12761.1 alginate export protein [Pontibacter ummariensis]SNS47779.1 Alginate export [Pontibacter ummariensis]
MNGRNFTQTLLLATGLLLASSELSFAQFSLSAEIRPRAEFRDGFKTVRTEEESPAFFIEQRSRLNANYQSDKLRLRLALQDVRVWGHTSQVYKADPSLFNVYEAYGEYQLTPRWAVRVGRQELDYDNARFLGNLDWAQQGRSHDAVRFMYADTTGFAVHAGAAFNQQVPFEPAKLTSTFYGGIDNYKTMQYLWLHKEWGEAKFSGLLFNDGRQRASDSTVFFRQTYGVLGEKTIGLLRLGGELYYQGGKDAAGTRVNAYLAAISATFVTRFSPLTIGADYLSGSEASDPRNKAFVPLYGTNHAFYGLMDYFYVGNNHGQSGRTAGLADLYLKTNFKLGQKSTLLAQVHRFVSPATVYSPVEGEGELASRLGEELDLVYNRNISPDFNLKAGYSQLYATESMEALKGKTGKSFNQWAWVMLTFKPVLFKQ